MTSTFQIFRGASLANDIALTCANKFSSPPKSLLKRKTLGRRSHYHLKYFTFGNKLKRINLVAVDATEFSLLEFTSALIRQLCWQDSLILAWWFAGARGARIISTLWMEIKQKKAIDFFFHVELMTISKTFASFIIITIVAFTSLFFPW